MSNNKLSICIAMGVLNEEKRLKDCLDNLNKQDFPSDRLHLMIADGGSTDATREIAESYGIKVYDNPQVLGDLGIKLLARECNEDLFLPWAPDNEFPRQDWLGKVVKIFEENSDISAFWGGILASKQDTFANKYYTLIQSDPLAWFLNKNLNKYLTSTKKNTFVGLTGYKLKIDPRKPLVCGANGFVFRFKDCRDLFLSSEKIMENDIYQTMVERGNNKMVFVPQLGVYHHSIDSLRDWMRKWKRNYQNHYLVHYKERNLNWAYSGPIRFKLILWLIYSLCPLISGIDGLWCMVKSRNAFWLYHPLASFLQTMTYIRVTLLTKKGWSYLSNFILGKTFKKERE